MFQIFKIRQYWLGVIRGFEIAFILIEFLIIDRMSHRRWMFGLIPKKFKKDGIVQTEPERLRTVIELLGPTFVKFGQILADRPDIISDKLREELKKLQSTAEPFSHSKAIELIEEELGGKIEDFFIEFKREACIGSASIGQVYQGTLKNGEVVVIKIQRPDIRTKIELDLRILSYFAEQLVKDYPGFRVVDVVGIVEEFGDSLIKELNYLNEASNAIRFNSIFQNAPYCKIPKVYLDLTTDKMLVMEFVEGTPPDNRQLLLDAGLNPSEVARNGSVILLEMIFKHGFFHADPHPGNLFIQSNNTIAIIDFGMVGILKPAHMHFLAGFSYGLASNNASTITDAVLTLCGKKYFAERVDLEFYIRDMLNHHGAFSYENLDFSQILNECLKIIQRYDLKLPGNMFLLIKALATIEKFGFNLDPEMSLAAVIRPYAEHLIKEKFSPKQIAGDIFDTLKDYGSLVRDFPAEINEILYRLKKGRIGIDINIEDEKVLVNGFKQVGGVLSITLLLGFMLAGSTVLLIYGKAITAASILFGISVFFSVSLLMRLFIKTRL